jgi:acetylornithine deacetylase
MKIAIDRDYLRDALVDLVCINSINPGIAPTGPGEAEIGAHVADTLHKLKLEVATHEPEPGRTSVVGRLKSSGGGRSLMLNAHVETVGSADMLTPFSATLRDGRLYGRSACHVKGSLAACMAAVKVLVDAGRRWQVMYWWWPWPTKSGTALARQR